MSDSEDGAFASADEGDSTVKSEQTAIPKKETKDSDVKKKESVHKGQGDGADNSKSKTSSSAPGNSKGKGKQQQPPPQKKKGKSKNQQTSSKPTEQTKLLTDSASPNQNVTDKAEHELIQSKEQPAETEGHTDDKVASKSDSPVKTEKTVTSEVSENEIDRGTKESSPELNIEREAENKNSNSGWGWSSWGSSLLSAASTSVQTFTDQVGGGLSTIMDSVESSLGAPDPEELAKSNVKRENEMAADDDQDTANTELEMKDPVETEGKKDDETESNEFKGGGNWFAGWGVAGVAGIAKKVQNTGKSLASKGQTLMTEGFDAVENLASSGIDALESLGKKTYNTLSEHDPAFKKTREYLRSKNTKQSLSSVLKEAKEQAENEATQAQENEEARKGHFETQFDEYQGIAHLEALEMLSNQSEKKVHSLLNSLSSNDLKVIKPILISIKQVFEVDEEEEASADDSKDFSGLVNKYLSELELGSAPDKLNKVHEMVKQWLIDFDTGDSQNKDTPKIVHQQAIQSLAELTSKGVEQFHKAGEMVLMEKDSDKDFTERAHSFARLTGVLCHEVGNIASKFTDCLNKSTAEQEQKEDITRLVTNIYLEATNSSTYIQDAFQLLLPILQQAAIEHTILSRQS